MEILQKRITRVQMSRSGKRLQVMRLHTEAA